MALSLVSRTYGPNQAGHSAHAVSPCNPVLPVREHQFVCKHRGWERRSGVQVHQARTKVRMLDSEHTAEAPERRACQGTGALGAEDLASAGCQRDPVQRPHSCVPHPLRQGQRSGPDGLELLPKFFRSEMLSVAPDPRKVRHAIQRGRRRQR